MSGVENGADYFVNCGAFRPKWLKAKGVRHRLTFSFSVEVPMGEELAVSDDLRAAILESLSMWSRSFRVKMCKKDKERRLQRDHQSRNR
jgi:hypothetical protein